MTSTLDVARRRVKGVEDGIVVLDGVSWADYQRLLEIRGDRSVPRITYLEGSVEIMSPSRFHENIKSVIGCLVEVWCLEKGIVFTTLGAWTIEDKSVSRGAEADECYVFGPAAERTRPDLAIEVVWTSGGISKLEVYRKLDVREVWIWEDERLTPYVLRGDRFVEASASEALPGLDLNLLVSFLDRPTTSQAILDYRAALRSTGSSRTPS